MSEQLTSNQDACGSNCETSLDTVRPVFRTSETEDGVALQVLLPGVTSDGATLSSKGNILTVQGKRSDAVPDAWTVRQSARRPDAYELQVRLHSSLDPAKTSATLRDGILQLEISKREEAKPRQIELS